MVLIIYTRVQEKVLTPYSSLFSVVVQAPGINFFTYCFVTKITRSILSHILQKWVHYNPRDEENKLFKNEI
jgi:hypothetical protein